jgi:hypothetical protein
MTTTHLILCMLLLKARLGAQQIVHMIAFVVMAHGNKGVLMILGFIGERRHKWVCQMRGHEGG